MARRREEVLNVLLAQVICNTGMMADPENILNIDGARQMPDVLLSFRGLRCVLDGKYANAQNSKAQVREQVDERLASGLAHIGIGLLYPSHLRSFGDFTKLQAALRTAELTFFVATESEKGDWQKGTVDSFLEQLRHSYASLAQDDVVTRSVELLQAGMNGVIRELLGNDAACERLSSLLGVYEEDKPEQDDNEEE
ncbi:MAG: hypothetical protein AABN33_21985 [Acidobacteriota bacterium]